MRTAALSTAMLVSLSPGLTLCGCDAESDTTAERTMVTGPNASEGGPSRDAPGAPDAARWDGSGLPDAVDGAARTDGGLVAPGMPRIFFSDLDSGPSTGGKDGKGVFVTVYGGGFGSVRGGSTITVGGGSVDNYLVWNDSKVAFQLGSAAQNGDIVVHNTHGDSNGVPFVVRNGRILFVAPDGTGDGSFSSPMSPAPVHADAQPGDTYYFRAGTYAGRYGDPFWTVANYTFGATKKGTPGNPIALVGYPDEAATLRAPGNGINIKFSENAGASGHFTVANFTMVGVAGSVSGGGDWTKEKSALSRKTGQRIMRRDGRGRVG